MTKRNYNLELVSGSMFKYSGIMTGVFGTVNILNPEIPNQSIILFLLGGALMYSGGQGIRDEATQKGALEKKLNSEERSKGGS